MNNEPVLYIGVAGLLAEHVQEISKYYEAVVTPWDSDKRIPFLFLGLQTSRKSLNGEAVNPFYSSRMNTRDQIIEACRVANTYPMSKIIVHYNPSGGYDIESGVGKNVDDHISFLMSTDIKGLQWNGFSTNKSSDTLPRFPESLSNLIVDGHDFQSILQIGKQDYDNPDEFVVKIKDDVFVGRYTHFLVDSSGGKGIPIDEEKAMRFVSVVNASGNIAKIALSGGLGPNKLSAFGRIKKMAGDEVELSIDVEGNVRDEHGFSPHKAKAFLKEVINFYK